VGQLARDTLERSFQGKTAVTRRALSPLASIRDKLDGLAFLDGRFRTVVGEIDRLVAQVPAQGPIAHGVLAALTQFLSLAAQPDGLRTWAANASVWQTPPEFLGLPDPAAAPPSSSVDPTPTEAVQEPTSIPAPVPVSASTVDADAPASIEDTESNPSIPASVPTVDADAPAFIEDTESDPPTPASVPTVDAAADPLTVPLRSIQALVDEVIASAEPTESASASEPVTGDSDWFF